MKGRMVLIHEDVGPSGCGEIAIKQLVCRGTYKGLPVVGQPVVRKEGITVWLQMVSADSSSTTKFATDPR